MDRLHDNNLRRWIIPGATAAVFFLALSLFIPYSRSIGNVELPLGHLIWTLCHFGSTDLSQNHDPIDFTYCLFVPFIFAFLVYLRRDDLARAEIRKSNFAIACLALGIFLYWVGLRTEDQYFGYASLQILLAGMILWFWGWNIFRILLFAWAFFAFAWPLPFLDPIIALPLRVVMSHMAAGILPLIGIPCVQSGTALLSAADPVRGLLMGDRFQIDIADGCSGIRSLFALLMFSALFAYLCVPRLWQQWLIFFSAFPLAVIGNLARVLILVIATLLFGMPFAVGTTEHPSFFHEACGFAVYAVALGLEVGLASLLMRKWRQTPDQPDAEPASS